MCNNNKTKGFLVLKLKPKEKITVSSGKRMFGTFQLLKLESTVCKFLWKSKEQSQEIYLPKATPVDFKFKDFSLKFIFNRGSGSSMSLALQGSPPVDIHRGDYFSNR